MHSHNLLRSASGWTRDDTTNTTNNYPSCRRTSASGSSLCQRAWSTAASGPKQGPLVVLAFHRRRGNATAMIMLKSMTAVLLLMALSSFATATAWQGLLSLNATRWSVYDADVAWLNRPSSGEMPWHDPTAVAAAEAHIWHPDAKIARYRGTQLPSPQNHRWLTEGLLPYELGRKWGWIVLPSRAFYPGEQTTSTDVGSLQTAAICFAKTAAIGGLVTASTALLIVAVSYWFFKEEGKPDRCGHRDILRKALLQATVSIPFLVLVLAYGSYDRGTFYGPPVPNNTVILTLTALAAAFSIISGRRAGRSEMLFSRRQTGGCVACGYISRGPLGSRCSECGRTEMEAAVLEKSHRPDRYCGLGFLGVTALVVFWTPISMFTSDGTTPNVPGAGDYLLRWITMRITNDLTEGTPGFLVPCGNGVRPSWALQPPLLLP